MKGKEEIFEEFFKRIGVKIPWEVIDELVISDANILRPIKGAAFEILFDEVVEKYLKCKIEPGIGDSDIDRTLVSSKVRITLQLKTCSMGTIIEDIQLGVSLHKTHGEERAPKNLYPIIWPCPLCEHEGENFPDFLIVLHPKRGILIIPKDNIPEHKTYKGHFSDPAIFRWDSEWLDRYDLLGFPELKGKYLERRSIPTQKKLPKIAEIIKLTDNEIINMLLKRENFRILEMNLKGNLREPAMEKWLKTMGVSVTKPTGISYPKYDRITQKGKRIQIKGQSKGLCSISKKVIGVEVMGSHRQGADRMYSDLDFDYLGLVIDPQYIPDDIKLNKDTYHFCLIPLKELPLHFKNKEWGTKNKVYPCCKFEISLDSKGYYLKPSSNYSVSITFRGSGPWYIDKIPDDI